MSLITKIKAEVESAGFQFYYDSGGGLNKMLDSADFEDGKTVVFAFLLTSTSLIDGIESGNVGLFFSKMTDFDFEALENDSIQEVCKMDAWAFIRRLERGNTLTIGDVTLTRFYDEFSVNVTGVAVNATFTETVGLCQSFSDVISDITSDNASNVEIVV